MINGIIYKATNTINGKVYIGQTRQTIEIRKNAHGYNAKDEKIKKLYFYRAINKYGEDAFQWEEIDNADTPEKLNEKEIYWIDFYNSNGDGGYNLTDGGEGVRGYKVTEEGIERRRNVLKEMWANGHASTMGLGEDASNAKFTNNEVREIGESIMKGVNNDIISSSFNVSKSNIHSIKTGRTWSHLFTDEELYLMRNANLQGSHWFTEKEILEIRDLLLYSPLYNKEIAEIYEINETSIYAIPKSKKWSYLFSGEDKRKIKERSKKKNTTIEDVIQVKKLLKEGRFVQVEIAWIARVSSETVGKIKRGERWANVQIPENENPENEIP